jgi:PAS domain-containing protein
MPCDWLLFANPDSRVLTAYFTEERERMESWIKEFPAAITVCDTEGIILGMNDLACETFAADGGAALIGTNLRACHPEPARSTLEGLLHSGAGNVYTIEKSGKKKLIYQSPWFEHGVYRGLVEISLPLPAVVPHFDRDALRGLGTPPQ